MWSLLPLGAGAELRSSGLAALDAACRVPIEAAWSGTGAWSAWPHGRGFRLAPGEGPVSASFFARAKGWSDLFVRIEGTADERSMYAAGFLEGGLTKAKMDAFYANTRVREPLRGQLAQVFEAQLEEVGSHVGSEQPFWKQTVAMACQLLGLADGYAERGGKQSLWDLMRLNADGEIGDLEALLPLELRGVGVAVGAEGQLEAAKRSKRANRCSALVRLAPQGGLMVGHTTWEDYREMVRIMKRYDFPLPSSKSQRVIFSSYPGCITSTDDFLIGSSGVVLTETTVGTPSSKFLARPHVPDYMRTMAAFRLAASGEEFVEHFLDASGNPLTGTYGSDWLVVDFNRFDAPSGAVRAGALLVLDTGPGADGGPAARESVLLSRESVVKQGPTGSAAVFDATAELRKTGFWSSYNTPSLAAMRAIAGVEDEDPRKAVFHARAGQVATLEDLAQLMRRNDREDGVSAGADISARKDLAGVRFGGTDSKVVDAALVHEEALVAISGPTAVVDGRCQPFAWPNPPAGVPAESTAPWERLGLRSSRVWSGPEGPRDACFGAQGSHERVEAGLREMQRELG